MLKKRLAIVSGYLVLIVCILSIGAYVRFTTLLSRAHLSITDLAAPLPSSIEKNGVYTFLLLGIGGAAHDGPNLSDTIMLIKYDSVANTLTTLGLPRDLWDENTKDKINAIYTYSLQQTATDQYAYVKSHFQQITGQVLDHVVVVDFSTFQEVVDILGGIQVTNSTGFVDEEYPITGAENKECVPYDPSYACRYETISFPTGVLKMNGAVALKYVRSRHSAGDEGTDFSRSRRQQEVIQGISTKLNEVVNRRDFVTLGNLLSLLDDRIKRTISNRDASALARTMIMNKKRIRIITKKIDMEYFDIPPLSEYDGRYVLIPPDKDYANLKSLIRSLLP